MLPDDILQKCMMSKATVHLEIFRAAQNVAL
jgi:hypothetical protein